MWWEWLMDKTREIRKSLAEQNARDRAGFAAELEAKRWNGVHSVTIRPILDGALPSWRAECRCGWESYSWYRRDLEPAVGQFPHPRPLRLTLG